MDFGGHSFTLGHLLRYARTAEHLGFDMLCANDHLVFAVPWLDGPTALAAVIEASGQMTLATTVALVAVRGPVPVAKALAAIDRLSGGRLLVAAALGSSPGDYDSVGMEFGQRWARLDEAVRALRVLWGPRPTAVYRAVLLHRRDRSSAPPCAGRRSAHLDRQLGLRSRAAAGRPPRGRLAGVGLQHHTGAVRRGAHPPERLPCRPRQGP